MSNQRLTRRSLTRGILVSGTALAIGPILAACGGSSTPAVTTSGGTTPAANPSASSAAVLPTTGPATPQPAATTAPAGAGGGNFEVWFNANWNDVTNKAVGDAFITWGKSKGKTVEYQVLQSAQDEKLTAALQAGQPPDIDQAAASAYWWKLGELVDLTDLYNQVKGLQGGMLSVGHDSVATQDGKVFGITYAIDGWAIHQRKSLLQQANDGKWPETWDEYTQIAPKMNQLPKVHAWGMAIGHEGDHFNNIITIVWAHGGAIANEKGEPNFNTPETVAAINLIKHQYVDLKLIPQEGWAATVTSYNNEQYQKKAAATIINPTSVYGWLQVNDKELLADTLLFAPPKGPKGSFSEAGNWSWAVMKKSKQVDDAKDAVSNFMQPNVYNQVLNAVLGRWVPVYNDMLNTDFWKNGQFTAMSEIAKSARTRAYPLGNASWRDNVESTNVLSDMLHKVCVDNMPVADAVGWAQQQCQAIYQKLGI